MLNNKEWEALRKETINSLPGNLEDKEDIVQETMITIFKSGKPSMNIGAFARTVAQNKKIDLWRMGLSRINPVSFSNVGVLDIVEMLPLFSRSPEEVLMDKVDIVEALRMLSDVEDDYQAWSLLMWVLGYDSGDIQQLYGIPSATTRIRIMRCKTKIRNMQRCEVSP